MKTDKIKDGSLQIGKTGWYLTAETEGGYKINFQYVKLPNLQTVGVSSICEDQDFVLFMDFDNIAEDQLRSQLQAVCRRWSVTHFFIFETGHKRYHVISLEKFRLSTIRAILRDTMVDYAFKTVAVTSDKGWILRLYPKLDRDGRVIQDRPAFKDVIVLSRKPHGKLSRAHIELYSLLYPEVRQVVRDISYFDESNMDEYTDVRMISYPTSNENVRVEHNMPQLSDSKKLRIIWEDHLPI